MKRAVLASACLAAVVLSGCAQPNANGEEDASEALRSVNVIDESNLNELMLNSGSPEEAIAYFREASADNPGRIDLKRGLAGSLVRGGKNAEGARVWAEVVKMPGATNEDRVSHADALIRAGDWDAAEAELNGIPPTHETYSRYRLEAMIADSNKEWQKADSFYEIAAGLTTTPSGVLNNWGFSKLTRGDHREAERLFAEAVKYDPSLFTAKNNMALARAAQRNYDLPIVPMSQSERAQLLHTLALGAIKQGDVTIGKGLLRQAIDTSPQHFEAAVRSLEALEAGQLPAG
jgi:Flp pilus assembly protein TadD